MTRNTAPTGHPGAAIEEIAALGPFFAFTPYGAEDPLTGAAPRPAADGAAAEAGEWQPLDTRAVAARVTAVRRWLAAAGGQPAGSVELRVAASVAHLGLAARLLSPELAAAVLHGRLLTHPLAAVRWQPVLGGPAPLALPAARPSPDAADTDPQAARPGHCPPELPAARRTTARPGSATRAAGVLSGSAGVGADPSGPVLRPPEAGVPARTGSETGAAGVPCGSVGVGADPSGPVLRPPDGGVRARTGSETPDAGVLPGSAGVGADRSGPGLPPPDGGVRARVGPGTFSPAPARPDALAGAFALRLATGPLAELAAAHGPFGVSPHILLGNTASALNGAAAMIAAARPELAATAAAFAADVLGREPLRAQAGRAGGVFRRRSCCLIYRAAPDRRGALCGDCALRRPGGRRP